MRLIGFKNSNILLPMDEPGPAYIRANSGQYTPVSYYSYPSAKLNIYVAQNDNKVFNSWGGEVVPDNGSFRFKTPVGTFELRFTEGDNRFELRQRAYFNGSKPNPLGA